MANLGRLLLAAAGGGAKAFADKRLHALELLEKIREEQRVEEGDIREEERSEAGDIRAEQRRLETVRVLEQIRGRQGRRVERVRGRQRRKTDLAEERGDLTRELIRAMAAEGQEVSPEVLSGPIAGIVSALGEMDRVGRLREEARADRPKDSSSPSRVALGLAAARGDPEAIRALEYLNQVGVRRPLTGTAETQLINRLVKDWKVASKPAADLHRQAKLMQVGLNAARRGDMAAGSQAVLVTFQKILDPTSVVRESEYARSASGLSLISQIIGASERLRKGGAGVPLWDLETFARLAAEAVQALSTGYVTSVKNRIGLTADRYNIPRELIFEDFDFMAAEKSAIEGDDGELVGGDDPVERLSTEEIFDLRDRNQ